MTLDELETLREGWSFEAKKAQGRDGRGALPHSLWETYSAMANSQGGYILLGAKEQADGSLELVGIPNLDKVERDLWNVLQDRNKVSTNLFRQGDVQRIETSDGRWLLLLRVPKAGRAERPVYLDGSVETGTWLRVHEGDRRVPADRARRMMADRVVDRDVAILGEFTLSDLHTDSVQRYRQLLASRRPDHPFLQKDEPGFLMSIGAARVPREPAGPPRPTWAGLCMFGEEQAIRELFPHWHLSYVELPDDPSDSRRWLDRVHPDGTWNANVFEFYLRAIRRLHESLVVPFALEGGQFRVEESPVHEAVREALVNTLVHADYHGATGVRIRRKRSGFEFINPGLLLITPEQVWRGGVSVPRNPGLLRMFSQVRLGEREGSGGPTMRRVWRAQHWRAPRIVEDTEHGEVHLHLPLESLFSEAAVNDLVARLGDGFTKQDELGRVILVVAETEGSIDHARVSDLNDAHSRDITLKLQQLVRQGVLVASGHGRGRTYAPAGRRPMPLFDSGQSEGPPSDATPVPSDATPARTDATSECSDATPGASDASLTGSDATPGEGTPLSAAMRAARNSRRASQDTLDQAILDACRGHYRTREEIADRVGRAVNTLRARFLPRLVKQGRLVLRYPDRRHHPSQAYRTAEHDGEAPR